LSSTAPDSTGVEGPWARVTAADPSGHRAVLHGSLLPRADELS
jgi:hypothetical protein